MDCTESTIRSEIADDVETGDNSEEAPQDSDEVCLSQPQEEAITEMTHQSINANNMDCTESTIRSESADDFETGDNSGEAPQDSDEVYSSQPQEEVITQMIQQPPEEEEHQVHQALSDSPSGDSEEPAPLNNLDEEDNSDDTFEDLEAYIEDSDDDKSDKSVSSETEEMSQEQTTITSELESSRTLINEDEEQPEDVEEPTPGSAIWVPARSEDDGDNNDGSDSEQSDDDESSQGSAEQLDQQQQHQQAVVSYMNSSAPPLQQDEEQQVISSPPALSAPPTTLQEQNQEGSRRHLNEQRYQDIRETGRWGKIQRGEMCLVSSVMFALIVTCIVISVVLSTRDNNDDSDVGPVTTPTFAPTSLERVSKSEVLDYILSEINKSPSSDTRSFVDNIILPNDVSFYNNERYEDTTEIEQIRAISWILNSDSSYDNAINYWLLQRYALAVLYLTTNGETSWINTTNWLSYEGHTCSWVGLYCNSYNTTHLTLDEIDLSNNNLAGQLPNDLELLTDLKSLTLRNNKLTGELPGVAISKLPKLTKLYLQDNQFTGEVSKELANGIISSFFIYHNNFTGKFPAEFCSGPGLFAPKYFEFGIDCSKLKCYCCWGENQAWGEDIDEEYAPMDETNFHKNCYV